MSPPKRSRTILAASRRLSKVSRHVVDCLHASDTHCTGTLGISVWKVDIFGQEPTWKANCSTTNPETKQCYSSQTLVGAPACTYSDEFERDMFDLHLRHL